MEAGLKFLRTVRFALLTSIVLYSFLCFRAPIRPQPNSMVFRIIALLAITIVGTVFLFRRKLILSSERVLSSQPEDTEALLRWRKGYVIVWALCEAIALYGVVLRYMGFSLSQVSIFLASGLVLMLFYAPRQPRPPAGELYLTRR